MVSLSVEVTDEKSDVEVCLSVEVSGDIVEDDVSGFARESSNAT